MLSTLISAYKQEDVTVAHVKGCMESSVVPDEIVVVNDHGDENLLDKLRALERNTKIVYAYIDKDIPWNYTGARNLAFWLSRGDFLSFEDNDNIPSEFAYKDALQILADNPHIGRVAYGRRKKISKADAISKPLKECTKLGIRPRHQDTFMLRREIYSMIKGNDERFAGKYAWASSDLKRRMMRYGVTFGYSSTYFYTVFDAETETCKCTPEERDMNTALSWCARCKLPVWRKSFTNYKMARYGISDTEYAALSDDDKRNFVIAGKRGYALKQSPSGILNFTYDVVIL